MSMVDQAAPAVTPQLKTAVETVVAELARLSPDETPAEVIQALLSVAAKRYVECREAGRDFGPFVHDDALNATEVMVSVTNMLHAAEIEIFELAMWAMPGTGPAQEASS